MMHTLVEILGRIGTASVDPFWLPVVTWTLVASPVYLLLRTVRTVHPAVRYVVCRSVLLALPFALAIAPLTSSLLPGMPVAPRALSVGLWTPPSDIHLVVAEPAGATGTTAPGAMHLLGLLMVAAAGTMAIRITHFVRHAAGIRALRQYLKPLRDEPALALHREICDSLDIRRDVRLFEAPDSTVPFTFGHYRPVVVLPRGVLSDRTTLRAVLEHELLHVARSDFVLGIAEELTAAVFSFHPLVGLFRAKVKELREADCDADVLWRGRVSPGEYARILVSLGARQDHRVYFVLPVVGRRSALFRRIQTIKHLRTMHTRPNRHFRWSAGLASLIIPALLAACSTGVTTEPSPDATMTSESQEMQLKRLEVQMQYLTDEMERLQDHLQENAEAGKNPELDPGFRRFHMLQSMYMQRLEAYETMRLEAVTEKALRAMIEDSTSS